MENKLLLSICIPTYNRAHLLKVCLQSIFNQNIQNLPIEVVVSDNCSTDNTHEVVSEYLDNSKFIYIKQERNIGPIYNILNIVKNNSIGEFCWIIGDDDFIISGQIEKTINLIRNNIGVDFFHTALHHVSMNDYKNMNSLCPPFSLGKSSSNFLDIEFVSSVEELAIPPYSNVFLGEIMASIFRRSVWLSYDKIYTNNSLDSYLTTLENTYPHCVIFAHKFFGKKAIFIKTPLIMVLDGNRDWWNETVQIFIVQVRKLLKLYDANTKNKKLFLKYRYNYINLTLKHALTCLISNDKITKLELLKYLKFIAQTPLLILRVIFNKIF